MTDPATEAPTPEEEKEAAQEAKREEERKAFLAKAYDELNVTEEQVEQWKAQHRNVGLTFVGNRPFIFRSLRRPEFKQIRSIQTGQNVDLELLIQEKTATLCLLAPRLSGLDLQNENAGLPQSIADAVWEISDFQADTPTIRL